MPKKGPSGLTVATEEDLTPPPAAPRARRVAGNKEEPAPKAALRPASSRAVNLDGVDAVKLARDAYLEALGGLDDARRAHKFAKDARELSEDSVVRNVAHGGGLLGAAGNVAAFEELTVALRREAGTRRDLKAARASAKTAYGAWDSLR